MKYVAVIIPVLLWSTQAVLLRFFITGSAGVFEMNTYRAAGALLLGLVYCRGKSLTGMRPKNLLPGLALALNFVAFNFALKFIDAYLLMIIEGCSFVFSFIIDRMLKQRVRFYRSAFILYLAGLGFLAMDAWQKGSLAHVIGLLFAIVVSATFGVFNATLRLVGHRKNGMILVMLPVLTVSLVSGAVLRDFSAGPKDIAVMILIIGLVQTGGAYILWGLASTRFTGTRLAEFVLLTIPLAFVIEYLVLGVSVNIWQIAGAGILIGAAAVNGRKPDKKHGDIL